MGSKLYLDTGAQPVIIRFMLSKHVAQTSTTTNTNDPAPTMIPGAGNSLVSTIEQDDIAALTKYLESCYQSEWSQYTVTTTTSSRFPCTHGAQPGVYTGTADCCQCTNGKFYPVSPGTYSTKINGKATSIANPCPYTTIPSKTTDLRATIKPTHPKTTTKATLPLHAEGFPTGCVSYGAGSCSLTCRIWIVRFPRPVRWRLRLSFQHLRSRALLLLRTPTILPVRNTCLCFYTLRCPGGQAQRLYPDVQSNQKNKNLFLQVKFVPEVCAVGAPEKVNFKKDKRGWCRKNFLNVVNNCTYLRLF
jgi:hypothetical protein